MKTKEDSVSRKSVAAAPRDGDAARNLAALSPLLSEVLGKLRSDTARFAAVAPRRLDVFAGLSDYTGALSLGIPTGGHECVVAQRRREPRISVLASSSHGRNGGAAVEMSLDDVHAGVTNSRPTALPGGVAKSFSARCVMGTIVEGLRAGVLPKLSGGLDVAIASTHPEFEHAERGATLAAATLVAVAGAMDATPDAADAVLVCRRVQNLWLDDSCGSAGAACSLLGQPEAINQFRCEPWSSPGQLALSSSIRLAAVDSGVMEEDAASRFDAVRATTFMGRFLIDRIVRHDRIESLSWDGCLSRLSVTDYVDQFRDRIPTRLRGKEFIDRFGETGDTLTQVDPKVFYKVRSRTEHHIYEHARSCQFVECLSRAMRSSDDRALLDAGELMRASHWSYGQRCGLASVETDLLVNLIRKHGEGAGVYGAKATGRGCGGVVAVLMKASHKADEALNDALTDYRAHTGKTTTMLNGSLPGALIRGAKVV
ncbi:MAG: hypothetical protein AABZ12_02445 [Planctomycetota bacterium]